MARGSFIYIRRLMPISSDSFFGGCSTRAITRNHRQRQYGHHRHGYGHPRHVRRCHGYRRCCYRHPSSITALQNILNSMGILSYKNKNVLSFYFYFAVPRSIPNICHVVICKFFYYLLIFFSCVHLFLPLSLCQCLGCSGILWDALGCSGMLWDALLWADSWR